jgi:hypothetical protein
VKYAETSSPRDAISAISSAVGVFLDVFGITLLFLFGRDPGGNQVIVFTIGIMPDLEDHGTEPPPTPTDRPKLFRIVILLVDDVDLVEYLPRFL